MVVLSHAGASFVPGGSGVTIFFAVSGFIITHLLLRELDSTNGFRPGQFFLKRALKLFPPLLVVVIIPSLLFFDVLTIRLEALTAQALFYFNWYRIANPGNDGALPGSGIVWSLAIEEQFYIAFAILWLALSRVRRPRLALAILSTLVMVLVGAWRIVLFQMGAGADRIGFGTDTRIDAIAAGVLVAAVVRGLAGSRPLPRVLLRMASSEWLPIAASVVFVLSLTVQRPSFDETFRYSIHALCAAVWILWSLVRRDSALTGAIERAARSRPVATVGLASYSIYLVHYPLIELVSPAFVWLPVAASTVVLSVISIVAGVGIWRIIEVPVERFKRSVVGSSEAGSGRSKGKRNAGDSPGGPHEENRIEN